MAKLSFCVACKTKTGWRGKPKLKANRNRVLMAQGHCNSCGKRKSTIVPQFVKKQRPANKTVKGKKVKKAKGKNGGSLTHAINKIAMKNLLRTNCFGHSHRRNARAKRGGFAGTALSLVGQGVYEGMDALARSNLGAQGGNSAGNKARRAQFGWPPTGSY